MVESLYEILPTFWTGGLAEPFELESVYPDPSCTSYVWLGEPTLTEVRWLPRGRLHVVAIWRFERYDRRPREYPIPFFWAGLLPQEDYGSRSLRLGSDHIRLPTGPWRPCLVGYRASRRRHWHGPVRRVSSGDRLWRRRAGGVRGHCRRPGLVRRGQPQRVDSEGKGAGSQVDWPPGGCGHRRGSRPGEYGRYAGVQNLRLSGRFQGRDQSGFGESVSHVPRRSHHQIGPPGSTRPGYKRREKLLRRPEGSRPVGRSG